MVWTRILDPLSILGSLIEKHISSAPLKNIRSFFYLKNHKNESLKNHESKPFKKNNKITKYIPYPTYRVNVNWKLRGAPNKHIDPISCEKIKSLHWFYGTHMIVHLTNAFSNFHNLLCFDGQQEGEGFMALCVFFCSPLIVFLMFFIAKFTVSVDIIRIGLKFPKI